MFPIFSIRLRTVSFSSFWRKNGNAFKGRPLKQKCVCTIPKRNLKNLEKSFKSLYLQIILIIIKIKMDNCFREVSMELENSSKNFREQNIF